MCKTVRHLIYSEKLAVETIFTQKLLVNLTNNPNETAINVLNFKVDRLR